jgi:serine/threonine protein kinase
LYFFSFLDILLTRELYSLKREDFLKAAVDDWVGQILDKKYEIIRLLGHGGMGSVFEAVHLVLRRHVAIKILNPIDALRPGAIQRFIREGQAASAIDHPNIVEVQDFGKQGTNTYYIVMELLKGDTLQSVLDYRGVLPPDHAVIIALQVLSALSVAHDKGIIHRDLKPDNIYLSASAGRGEHVKIMDFGVAKYKSPGDTDLRLTATGTVLGTPYYLAPEQAKGGRDIDERIDVWSVGVILYEMLTGRVPFEGENYNEVVSNILLKEYIPPKELVPDLPDGLVQVVDKALAKDRHERYDSAAAMMSALLPLGHQMDYFMSTGAMQAIRNSVAPPPLSKSMHTDTRRTGPPHVALAETTGYDGMESAESVPPHTRASVRSRLRSGAIAAALAAVVSAVLVTVVFGEDTTQLERSVTVAGVVDPGTGVSSKTVRAVETGEAEPAFGVPDQDATSTLNKEVTLDIEGLPSNAEITLDGGEVSLPITVARSDTPMRLKIEAPGFRAFDRVVVPSQDQVISVEMKKMGSQHGTMRSQKRNKSNTSHRGGWRANPFEK